MFQAPNLHLAMQLLITVMQTKDSINIRVFLKVGESFQGGLISLHSYFIINSIITMKTRQVWLSLLTFLSLVSLIIIGIFNVIFIIIVVTVVSCVNFVIIILLPLQ